MRHAALVAILLLSGTTPAVHGGEGDLHEGGGWRLVERVRPRARLESPILYLVDVSCSMGGTGPAAETLEAALSGLDDGRAGVVAWGVGTARLLWGREGERRWLRLPDARATESAARWLRSLPRSPATALAPALQVALDDSDVRSVVVVSDGLLDDAPTALSLARALAKRRVVIAGLLVPSEGAAALGSASGPGLTTMAELARVGGGGLWERRR